MLGHVESSLYVTEPPMDALLRTLADTFGKRLLGVEKISAGQDLRLASIDVHAFAIPHDAGRPHRIYVKQRRKIRACDRFGLFAELVKVHLRDADCFDARIDHDLIC